MIRVKPLTDEEILKKIVEIVSKYIPDCRIYLFGSRAKGTARKNSDFDIAVDCSSKIPFSVMAKIEGELEELPTLKSFDLVDLSLASDDFKETVIRTGVVLYDRRAKRETETPFKTL